MIHSPCCSRRFLINRRRREHSMSAFSSYRSRYFPRVLVKTRNEPLMNCSCQSVSGWTLKQRFADKFIIPTLWGDDMWAVCLQLVADPSGPKNDHKDDSSWFQHGSKNTMWWQNCSKRRKQIANLSHLYWQLFVWSLSPQVGRNNQQPCCQWTSRWTWSFPPDGRMAPWD